VDLVQRLLRLDVRYFAAVLAGGAVVGLGAWLLDWINAWYRGR